MKFLRVNTVRVQEHAVLADAVRLELFRDAFGDDGHRCCRAESEQLATRGKGLEGQTAPTLLDPDFGVVRFKDEGKMKLPRGFSPRKTKERVTLINKSRTMPGDQSPQFPANFEVVGNQLKL